MHVHITCLTPQHLNTLSGVANSHRIFFSFFFFDFFSEKYCAGGIFWNLD